MRFQMSVALVESRQHYLGQMTFLHSWKYVQIRSGIFNTNWKRKIVNAKVFFSTWGNLFQIRFLIDSIGRFIFYTNLYHKKTTFTNLYTHNKQIIFSFRQVTFATLCSVIGVEKVKYSMKVFLVPKEICLRLDFFRFIWNKRESVHTQLGRPTFRPIHFGLTYFRLILT